MSMFSTGILVLTSPLHTLPLRIAPVLSSAAQVVERTLYVHLHPGLNLGVGGGQPRPVFIPPVVDLSSLITGLYSNAANVCGHLDVRVLLTNVRAQPNNASSPETGGTGVACNPFPSPQPLSHSPEVVLTDFALQDPGQSPLVAQCLQRYTGYCYVCTPGLASVLLHPQLQKLEEEVEKEGQKDDWDSRSERMETYSEVVVGGTFDRLHGAHKTLLNISCLLANKRFLIGVCDQELLKKKVLKELIEPYALRVQRLHEFLQDVKPSLQYEIVPLSDPFGPSVIDPQLQCIVVSEETRRGGEAVNKKRLENGLPGLVLHEIQLLKDAHHTEMEEEKISSSSLRSRLLGTLLTDPKQNKSHLPLVPYVIGLTGSSGSGKSSIAQQLEAMGAVRIDSDQLGHETYQPGEVAYNRVLEEFGSDLINEDKTINRRALGRKVFGNKVVNRISACLADISVWMTDHHLKLNLGKTELLFLPGKDCPFHDLAITVDNSIVSSSQSAKNLGVILDNTLSFSTNIKAVTRSCRFMLYNIRRVRPCLTQEAAQVLIQALVISRLDYCNSLLAGLPACAIKPLQLIQNAAARLVFNFPKFSHVTPLLRSLHWLPVEARIRYKTMVLAYGAVRGTAPPYLQALIRPYTQTRALRSSTSGLLASLPLRKYSSRSAQSKLFAALAPQWWNKLPHDARSAESITTFRRHLKPHLFKEYLG
ncbi:bifunctional coenzyme A synthase isoform 3-T3 [Salvelinus alpinus]